MAFDKKVFCDAMECISFNFLTLIPNDFAIKEHLFCNNSSTFDDFSILASNNNDFKVTLMEIFSINRDQAPLNKIKCLLPLELFDD